MSRKYSKDDLEKFHDYDIFVPTRTIYLGSQQVETDGEESGTDALMAARFVKNLHFLERKSKKLVTIWMNNLGGFWCHGMEIYAAIKDSPCKIRMIGRGQVMSMGSVILQAADERLLTPGTEVMIHDGAEGFLGETRSFEAWGEFAKKRRKQMYQIYASKSNKPESFWARKCAHDCPMTAEEAVKLGLADRVTTSRKK